MSDVVSLLRSSVPPGTRKGFRRAPSARSWYERGLELESIDLAAARDAYQRALRGNPHLADASCNLGRLLHEAGDLPGAERCYRAALVGNQEVAVYWFNLGVVLEDLGRCDEAIAMYREALGRNERLADAHFNLARLCERVGDLESARAAVRHWQAYRATQKDLYSRPRVL